MKKYLLAALFSLVTVGCFAQSLGISFYDHEGREFVVYAPSGRFSYTMYQGDYINRDYAGRIINIGDTFLSYDYNGRVIRIDDVFLSYDYNGWLIRVGGLFISYDMYGNILYTSGSVR
ncbi:MAG: hypothetical protein ACI392_07145 [Paludibacteraceae bacterium]